MSGSGQAKVAIGDSSRRDLDTAGTGLATGKSERWKDRLAEARKLEGLATRKSGSWRAGGREAGKLESLGSCKVWLRL